MTAVPTAGLDFPNRIELLQNHPNPFNARTRISYVVGSLSLRGSVDDWSGRQEGSAVLRVYDILGREVATLADETKEAGTYSITWDAAGQPSGVYFYRLEAGGQTRIRRMVLLK
jgi:hypothetical protein